MRLEIGNLKNANNSVNVKMLYDDKCIGEASVFI